MGNSMTKLRFTTLKENFYLQLIALLGIVFLLAGKPVPYSNEYSYLLRLKNLYDPNYLAHDITFSARTNEYWLFEHIFGLLTLIFSLETVGWIGRIFCWSILLFALMKLGKRWKIPIWTISVSIFLWLCVGQSFVADEWMFGDFEAKCVAYICLIFALDFMCGKRDISAAILLGLAFSFHPIIGLWGIAAAIPAFLIWHRDIFRTAKITAIAGVFSLFGVISLLQMRANSVLPTTENLKYFELVKFPYHFDPFAWSKSSILLVFILTAFCLTVHFQIKEMKPPQFLINFLTMLAIFFAFGILIRAVNQYEIMEFTPTRLPAVFVPLFFLFYLSRAYQQNLLQKPLQIALLFPIIFLTLWNRLPMTGFEQAKSTYQIRTQPPDDLAAAFVWLKTNTPEDVIVIAPPWRYDFWYLSERAEVVNYRKPIIVDVGEWQSRLDQLIGKADPEDGARDEEELAKFYDGLNQEQIDALAAEYTAAYLISETDYQYPVVFSSGNVKIFRLSPTH